jgi:hypothetical protein
LRIEKFINNYLLVVNMVEDNSSKKDESKSEKINPLEVYKQVVGKYSKIEELIGQYDELKSKGDKDKGVKEQLDKINAGLEQYLLSQGILQDELKNMSYVDWTKGYLAIVNGKRIVKHMDGLVGLLLEEGVKRDNSSPDSMIVYKTLKALEDAASEFGLGKIAFFNDYKNLMEKIENNEGLDDTIASKYIGAYVDKFIVPVVKENLGEDEQDILDDLKKFYNATYLNETDNIKRRVIKRAVKKELIEEVVNHKDELYELATNIANEYTRFISKYTSGTDKLNPEKAYGLYTKIKDVYETMNKSYNSANSDDSIVVNPNIFEQLAAAMGGA